MRSFVIVATNLGRTDPASEREFPGKIGDDGDGLLYVLTSTTERLRAIRVGFARIDDAG